MSYKSYLSRVPKRALEIDPIARIPKINMARNTILLEPETSVSTVLIYSLSFVVFVSINLIGFDADHSGRFSQSANSFPIVLYAMQTNFRLSYHSMILNLFSKF